MRLFLVPVGNLFVAAVRVQVELVFVFVNVKWRIEIFRGGLNGCEMS
jgi:hypothetical protein